MTFLPNSLTTPSPIPLDPPVTMVTFPAYLRFNFPASVAIFPTAVPEKLPKYINYNVFALNIVIKQPSSGTQWKRPEAKVVKQGDDLNGLGRGWGLSHRVLWDIAPRCVTADCLFSSF